MKKPEVSPKIINKERKRIDKECDTPTTLEILSRVFGGEAVANAEKEKAEKKKTK